MWKCNNCGAETKIITEKITFKRINRNTKSKVFQNIEKSFFICECSKLRIEEEKIENIAEWVD